MAKALPTGHHEGTFPSRDTTVEEHIRLKRKSASPSDECDV